MCRVDGVEAAQPCTDSRMLLTQCTACAAPLGLASGKKCSRCSTRYCGPACQAQHWKEGGHDKLCKKIKRAGGAEQFHADNKYKEAVAVAVEKCAEDTKGQTCYICTEALHWKTKEDLVRGCACRGTAGFAHVSCLAKQAKILMEEAEENNLGGEAKDARMWRWCKCSLCEQNYHGVVACALGWAFWKTYLSWPEEDTLRCVAINILGNGLYSARHYEAALSVRETELSMVRRVGVSEGTILCIQSNLASTYSSLDRLEDALRMEKYVYLGNLKLNGEEHERALQAATNYASSLINQQLYEEAKALLRKTEPVARRVLGDYAETTLKMRFEIGWALYMDAGATLDDLREAVTTLADTERIARRVLGGAHPLTTTIEGELGNSRATLRAHEEWTRLETLGK